MCKPLNDKIRPTSVLCKSSTVHICGHNLFRLGQLAQHNAQLDIPNTTDSPFQFVIKELAGDNILVVEQMSTLLNVLKHTCFMSTVPTPK